MSPSDPGIYVRPVRRKNAWDRLPDEPQRWHARFQEYLLLPPTDRSVLAALQKVAAAFPDASCGEYRQWLEASKRFRWDRRAEAHDQDMIEKRRAKSAARLEEIDAKLLTVLEKNMEMIATMQKWPVIKTKDGGKTYLPANWGPRDIVRMMEASAKLAAYLEGAVVLGERRPDHPSGTGTAAEPEKDLHAVLDWLRFDLTEGADE